ncbi:uncharacterized protein LOC122988070 isoform X1 [Thunnus albacares]|uniref:uncharacterized protein LOC122988070 isoform X1 n=1 Tax=Thunnus albacares TaxID=8236 RepID=UPI001CF60CC6|nr:uncharacterized protein LOC122988070 isoform X1 [Thunnus albacares]
MCGTIEGSRSPVLNMCIGRKTIESICGFTGLIFTIVNIRMIAAATLVLQKAVLGKPVELVYWCGIHNISGVMLTNFDSNQSAYVLLYHDNRQDPTNQIPLYQGKVDLDDRRMTNGTLVFTLQNMNNSFVGKYYCYVFQNGERILLGIIDLSAEDPGEFGGINGNHKIWPVISVIFIFLFIILVKKYRKHLNVEILKFYYKSCDNETQTVV